MVMPPYLRYWQITNMQPINRQKGFTLIEMVMVIVLLGIVGVVMSKMLSQSLLAVQTEQQVTDAVWQGQIAVQRMVREITAVRSPADISTASAGTFAFTDNSGTAITYTLSGSTITRNGTIVADGINSLSFTYQDLNGATTAVTTSICYVTLSVNVTLNNANYTITSAVNLRDIAA